MSKKPIINVRRINILTLWLYPTSVMDAVRSLVRDHDSMTAQCAEYRTESVRLGKELALVTREYDKLSTITRIYTRVGSDGTEN